MILVCEHLLKCEIQALDKKEKLNNQEECWREACERELLLISQLKLSDISYYGMTRSEFVEKIADYTINL